MQEENDNNKHRSKNTCFTFFPFFLTVLSNTHTHPQIYKEKPMNKQTVCIVEKETLEKKQSAISTEKKKKYVRK